MISAEKRREARARRWAENPERERTKEAAYRAKQHSKPAFKEYNRQAAAKHYRNNTEWRSLNIRLRNYGLTLDQFHAKLEAQDFQCAICGKDETLRQTGGYPLAIDHCHTSGKVRGLLCHQCNSAIGQLYDSPDLMRKAITYVEHWSAR